MDWRLVRQPNGLFGRFDLTLNDFTHMHMNHDDARDVCIQEGGTRDQAMSQVVRADNDLKGGWDVPKGAAAGLRRWQAALMLIEINHGEGPRQARERFGHREHTPDGPVSVIRRTTWEKIISGQTERDFRG